MVYRKRLTKQQTLEAEAAVSQVMVMRMTMDKSLTWIKDNYHIELGQSTYSKIKRKIDDNVTARLYEIGKGGFLVQHDKRIKSLETIEMELWKLYHKAWEDKDMKEAHSVLNDIAYIQPYMAAFYESTKAVMEYHHNAMNIENKTQTFDLDRMGDNDII